MRIFVTAICLTVQVLAVNSAIAEDFDLESPEAIYEREINREDRRVDLREMAENVKSRAEIAQGIREMLDAGVFVSPDGTVSDDPKSVTGPSHGSGQSPSTNGFDLDGEISAAEGKRMEREKQNELLDGLPKVNYVLDGRVYYEVAGAGGSAKVGSLVAGYRVKTISPDHVVFEKSGKRFEVAL